MCICPAGLPSVCCWFGNMELTVSSIVGQGRLTDTHVPPLAPHSFLVFRNMKWYFSTSWGVTLWARIPTQECRKAKTVALGRSWKATGSQCESWNVKSEVPLVHHLGDVWVGLKTFPSSVNIGMIGLGITNMFCQVGKFTIVETLKNQPSPTLHWVKKEYFRL